MKFLIISVIVCVGLCYLRTNKVVGSKIIMSGPQVVSHVMVQSAIASELIARGHEVYMAIGSRIKNPGKLERLGIKILHYHIPEDVIFGLTEDFDKTFAGTIFNQGVFDQGLLQYQVSAVVTRDCSLMMQDESFKRKAKEMKFDLAFVEPFFYAPCNLILARYLDLPFVSMATMLLPWELRIPALPSFYRVLGWFPIVEGTTFTGVLTNLYSFILAETSKRIPGPHNNTLLEQYAPEIHTWKELIRKSELILTDIDHHMGVPMPTFPYIVTVPGLSTQPAQTLEPAMETLFSENSHGVVVMSLGSMVHYLPDETMQKFLEAFSRLKQTVIARINSPTERIAVPTNVKLFSWLPQNDLLGHANTRLLITHCGNSGQHEMLYHGVPFVGLPIFADQHMNCHLAHQKGYGLMMNIFQFTSEELYLAIEEVLKNENYTKAIKKASEIFRDEPMTGRKKAVHWTEHVIKYGGSHLRSKSLDLPFYQFLMLDVLGVLVILSITILLLIKYLIGFVVSKIWNRKSVVTRKGIMHENKSDSHKFKLG